MSRKILNTIFSLIHWPILIGIIIFAAWVRWSTANFDILLDYDPWWFFRHAEEIYNNGFLPPKWDILSYYPPGRPVDYYLGWSYTLAGLYAIVQNIYPAMTLMKFSGYFVAIFAALCAIPAYLVGRYVTNRWGGLVTALFATVTPTFLTVSMAGYPDSDAVDVFYTFWAVLATLYALKKSSLLSFTNLSSFLKSLVKYLPHVVPALAAYWLFAFNWNSSWYIYYFFLAFVPILLIFKFIEAVISAAKKEGRFIHIFLSKLKDVRTIFVALVLIGLLGEAVTLPTYRWPFNTIPPHQQLIEGLNIVRGQSMVVFISVAELQPPSDALAAAVSRIGGVPIFFAFLAFVVTIAKLIFRKEIHLAEYFAIIWLLLSLWLISKGIRFALLFSMAAATAAGFTVGNLLSSSMLKRNEILFATASAFIIFAVVLHIDANQQFSKFAGGLEVSGNWKEALTWLKNNADKDALIATWWDPGHIITGFTGLKVHADGAHCPATACIFYDNNLRIQDMGRTFATSSETEAITILSKYKNLTAEQCREVKLRFGDLVPDAACKPVSEMYVIASADLIGKFYWLTFFGTGEGKNFLQLPISGQQNNNLIYGGIIMLGQTQDGRVAAVVNAPEQGVRNAIISDVVVYQQGQEQIFTYKNATNIIDGMLWVSPDYNFVIFMQKEIRDSIFTKMFFFEGKGLTRFEKVFSNPEVKIFKVKF
jgi:asparagine N-glycosylation enzyme membrane subunit Stt3